MLVVSKSHKFRGETIAKVFEKVDTFWKYQSPSSNHVMESGKITPRSHKVTYHQSTSWEEYHYDHHLQFCRTEQIPTR